MSDKRTQSEPDNSDLESLAEVIRLQAEALSRISGRMAGQAGHSGQPGHGGRARPEAAPSAVPPPVPPPAPERSAALPVLARDPALSEDATPVLNTFREFLEAERRRARQRMLVLAFGFVVLLAGALASFVYFGRVYMDQVERERKAERAAAEQDRLDAEEQLSQVAQDARQAAYVAAKLKYDMTNTLRSAQSNLTVQLDNRDAEMKKLKDALTALQRENAGMSNSLHELRKRAAAPPPPPLEPAMVDMEPELEPEAVRRPEAAVAAGGKPPAAADDTRKPEPRVTVPVTRGVTGSGPILFRLPSGP